MLKGILMKPFIILFSGKMESVTIHALSRNIALNVCREQTLDHAVLVGDAGSGGDATGLMVWAGSYALCSFIVEHCRVLEGKSVIELGTGCGLLGSLAALCGAQDVILTDSNEGALELARQTIEANETGNRARVKYFDWCASEEDSMLADMVIASEVIYPSTLAESMNSLFDSVDRMLKQGGIFIMSYVERRKDTTRSLREIANNKQWTMSVVSWQLFMTKKPLLDAQVFIFRRVSDVLGDAYVLSGDILIGAEPFEMDPEYSHTREPTPEEVWIAPDLF